MKHRPFSDTYRYYEPYTYASNYTDYEEQDYDGWNLVPEQDHDEVRDLVPGNFEELMGDEGNSSQGNDYSDYMSPVVRFIPLKQPVTTLDLSLLQQEHKVSY